MVTWMGICQPRLTRSHRNSSLFGYDSLFAGSQVGQQLAPLGADGYAHGTLPLPLPCCRSDSYTTSRNRDSVSNTDKPRSANALYSFHNTSMTWPTALWL